MDLGQWNWVEGREWRGTAWNGNWKEGRNGKFDASSVGCCGGSRRTYWWQVIARYQVFIRFDSAHRRSEKAGFSEQPTSGAFEASGAHFTGGNRSSYSDWHTSIHRPCSLRPPSDVLHIHRSITAVTTVPVTINRAAYEWYTRAKRRHHRVDDVLCEVLGFRNYRLSASDGSGLSVCLRSSRSVYCFLLLCCCCWLLLLVTSDPLRDSLRIPIAFGITGTRDRTLSSQVSF